MKATARDSSAESDRKFCNDMLPKVSRTFAICIRLLPQELEHSVLIAYLLCRIADTVEDTTSIDRENKKRLLGHFSSCLQPDGPDAEPLSSAFTNYQNDDEMLAKEANVVLREFSRLSTPQQTAIRPWVLEMCSGMADFLGSSTADSNSCVTSLDTINDLDRYCYYVAGTVGHMLTELFGLVQPPISQNDLAQMKSLSTSFGLGLQLTNIIKDVADDRQRGHNYVPRQLCLDAGIEPRDVQDTRYLPESRQVVNALVSKAQGHLIDALEYVLCVPKQQRGIRAFCLTSLFFAVKTLRLTENDDAVLDPEKKVKITRAAVVRTILATRLFASSNLLVKAYFRRLAGPDWWQRYEQART